MTPLESKSQFEDRLCASFQPLVNSPRKPTRNSIEGRSLMVSSAKYAPSSDRKESGVGEGITVKVATFLQSGKDGLPVLVRPQIVVALKLLQPDTEVGGVHATVQGNLIAQREEVAVRRQIAISIRSRVGEL